MKIEYTNGRSSSELKFAIAEPPQFVEMLKLATNVKKITLEIGTIWRRSEIRVWAFTWDEEKIEPCSRIVVYGFQEYGSLISCEFETDEAAYQFAEALKNAPTMSSIQVESANVRKTLRKVPEWVWTESNGFIE